MLQKFTTKELIFIALMGVAMFIIDFTLTISLVVATGTPLMGGLISTVFLAFMIALTALVVKKFGVFTLMLFIFTVLAVPTASFGPPGVYKIALGVFIALIIDIFAFSAGYKKWAYYVGSVIGFVAVVPAMLFTLTLLGLPGTEELAGIMFMLMGISVIQALIGVWIAMLVYGKIKHRRVIKQIQS